jgi:hypothetical protein
MSEMSTLPREEDSKETTPLSPAAPTMSPDPQPQEGQEDEGESVRSWKCMSFLDEGAQSGLEVKTMSNINSIHSTSALSSGRRRVHLSGNVKAYGDKRTYTQILRIFLTFVFACVTWPFVIWGLWHGKTKRSLIRYWLLYYPWLSACGWVPILLHLYAVYFADIDLHFDMDANGE